MHSQDNHFRKSSQLLDGWTFQIDPDKTGDQEGWEKGEYQASWASVTVPMAWNSLDPALWTYEGVGWYGIRIPAEPINGGERLRITFERYGYSLSAWIDGKKIGSKYGGDVPLFVELGEEFDRAGERLMILRVDNEPDPTLPPGSSVIERVIYGGLLKPVIIESHPAVWIDQVKIEAVPEAGGARITWLANVVNDTSEDFSGTVGFGVFNRSEDAVKMRVANHSNTITSLTTFLENIRAWSPDEPNLYEAMVRLDNEKGQVIDEVSERFGARTLIIDGNHILLNGEQLSIRGVNRYDEFAGVGPVASKDQIKADLLAIKSTGANFIRTHYPQDPVLLDLIDEVGLLIMEEVFINWWAAPFLHETHSQDQTAPTVLQGGLEMLEGMIRRDWNHPSIIAWSMANESGTTNDTGSRVMRTMMQRARELDHSRFVTFVAAGDARLHPAFEEADIVCMNTYPGVFGDQIARHIDEFELKVKQPLHHLLVNVCDAFPTKPVIITEFGCHAISGMKGDARFSEEYQSAYFQSAWEVISSVKGIAGGVLWCWADYYHRRTFMGTGLNAEYGPFGVVTVDRKPKLALKTLTDLYNQQKEGFE